MNNKTALKAEFTIKTIEGRIKDLAGRLYKLAPHPTNPDHRGPLFISLNSAFKPAAEYEGMLGSVMLESFLGNVFSDAANDNGAASALTFMGSGNLDVFAETLSEYAEYREDQKRGQGTYALGEHKTICNEFNDECDEDMLAYNQDLAERVDIEETIAHLYQDLCSLKGQKTAPELELCA